MRRNVALHERGKCLKANARQTPAVLEFAGERVQGPLQERMAGPVEYHSWTKPIVVLAGIAALLASMTALADNIDGIEDWLGVRDATPVSLTLQVNKLTRPNDDGVIASLSYKKAGPVALHDCRFWVDTGRLQVLGETPKFGMPAGATSKELKVSFQVEEPWALDFPNASVMLECDKASSAVVPLNLNDLPAGKP